MDRATELSIAFLETHPVGAARALERTPLEDAAAFVEQAPAEKVAAVLGFMQPGRAAAILERATPKHAAALLSQITGPARSVLLRALPEPVRDTLLAALPRRQAAALRRHLSYAAGTVGAWMDAPMATFAADTPVADCLASIRKLGSRLGSIVFVIDEDKKLLGTVAVEGLLSADDDALLADLMDKKAVRLSPQASLASVVILPAWDNALSLPVVQRGRRLVGVLHFDSLREGLLVDRVSSEGAQVNVLVMHLVQAFLVALSGLLNTAASGPALSRLTSEWED